MHAHRNLALCGAPDMEKGERRRESKTVKQPRGEAINHHSCNSFLCDELAVQNLKIINLLQRFMNIPAVEVQRGK